MSGINRIGFQLNNLGISGRRMQGLPASVRSKFLFLWTGRYVADDLANDLDEDVITVTGKDWTSKFISPDTEAIFSVPDNATYLGADGADNFWFDGSDILQTKTHADLIASTTERTFVKYADFEPYNVYAIGILKEGEILSDSDKNTLTRFFKLWVQYWGTVLSEGGYMKDNRELIED